MKLLKDYPEMLQDPVLEQEVCGEPAKTLFFDVRVTNTHSPSQIHLTIESVTRKKKKKHEIRKK